jgi:hypothetical protein
MQSTRSVYIINKAATAAPIPTPAPETPTLAAPPVAEAEAALPDPEAVEA